MGRSGWSLRGAIQDQLRNVQQVQATSEAFAAILKNGSVVAAHLMVVTALQSKTS